MLLALPLPYFKHVEAEFQYTEDFWIMMYWFWVRVEMVVLNII